MLYFLDMIQNLNQFSRFKFNSDGTMYLYEPGSGISGTPRRVVTDLCGDSFNFDCDKFCEPIDSVAFEPEDDSFPSDTNYHTQPSKVPPWKYSSISQSKIHRITPQINQCPVPTISHRNLLRVLQKMTL